MNTIAELGDLVEDQTLALNIGWVIFCGSMVFITQLGFFQLEAGHVSDIWIHSIILKNFEDAFAGILLFSMIGYGIVQTTNSSIFGYNVDYLFLHKVPESDYVHVFYQSLYAIASTTIVSSCVLERIKNKPYLCVIVFMTMIQFPMLSLWCWSEHGWLHKLGYIDFSGGSVVHTSGGIVGLILIIYLGNRQMANEEMFSKSNVSSRTKSNHLLTSSATGIFLLWFGWFGFNCGSAMNISDDPLMIGRVALNTALCSASGGAITLLIVSKEYLETIVNGVLIGLVAATGGAHAMQPWAAVLTGSISGMVIVLWKRMISRFGLDDPLSATAVHIGGGIVSVICTGLFHMERGLVYGTDSGHFFGIQLLGCTTIIVLSLFSALLFCFCLETTVGLRVDIFSGYLDIERNRSNVAETLNIAVTVRTPTTNAWLWHFHKFLEKRLSFEHLDFLVATNRLISKIDYFESKYGSGGTMDADKEELLLRDRDSFIELYLTKDSDYVVNISHTKLKFFETEKNNLQAFQLKGVLLEVYLEVLRMLQIPFTEWMHEYWERIKKEKQEARSKRGSIIRRFSETSISEGPSASESTDVNNAKYRKVYHVGDDYKIAWRIVRYSSTENCWCCLWIFRLFQNEITAQEQVLKDEFARPSRITSSRPSIVLPSNIPEKFRRCPRESFIHPLPRAEL